MPSYNHVALMGNVTRDPRLRHLQNQSVVVEFGLAVNRKWRTPEGEERIDTCFVDCTAWGKQGETIARYCQKGRPLFIDGRLKYDSWMDKQGTKHHKLSVVVENFQLIGARNRDGLATPGAMG